MNYKIIREYELDNLYSAELYPRGRKFHLGIEIEFFYKDDNKHNLAAQIIANEIAEYCMIDGDGSIRPRRGYKSCELKVCVPKDKLHWVMERLSDVFKNVDAQVNKSCGLHVHLDMRNKSFKAKEKIYKNLVNNQPILFESNMNRIKSNWCRPNYIEDYDKACDFYEKYQAINPQTDYETFEIRIHEGTVDTKRIIKWIELLMKASVKKLCKGYKENPLLKKRFTKDEISYDKCNGNCKQELDCTRCDNYNYHW